MTTMLDTHDPPVSSDAAIEASTLRRLAGLGYGVAAYGIGVAALLAWIFSMLGLLPFTGGPIALDGTSAALFNVGLMLAFGLQHSIMARPAFKAKWTKFVSPALERSTYVLATGLALGPVVMLWQPMTATIWRVDDPVLSWGLIGLAVFGWTYLFASTFAIDHFELFGLRQVYQYFRRQPVTPVPFKERWIYRFDRHPIMTGALLGMWITPHMQLDHLLFAGLGTVYIVIGVYFEERSLRRQWGSTYDDYRNRVRSIVPTLAGGD